MKIIIDLETPLPQVKDERDGVILEKRQLWRDRKRFPIFKKKQKINRFRLDVRKNFFMMKQLRITFLSIQPHFISNHSEK